MYDTGGLRLEYRKVGLTESPIQTVALALSEIQEITLKKGLVTDRLRIRARSMATLESLPGASSVDAGLVLKVKRRHRGDLLGLYDRFRLDHSEWRLKAMDLDGGDEG